MPGSHFQSHSGAGITSCALIPLPRSGSWSTCGKAEKCRTSRHTSSFLLFGKLRALKATPRRSWKFPQGWGREEDKAQSSFVSFSLVLHTFTPGWVFYTHPPPPRPSGLEWSLADILQRRRGRDNTTDRCTRTKQHVFPQNPGEEEEPELSIWPIIKCTRSSSWSSLVF